MKKALEHLTQYIRKSLIRFFFIIGIMACLQLAQLHEIYNRILPLEPVSVGKERIAEIASDLTSVEQDESEITESLQVKTVPKMNAFSINVYMQSWKSLAELDFWRSPITFYEKRTSDAYLKAAEQYYPAIAVTPLSLVYGLYGYVAVLLLFVFLRFIAWLFLKKPEPVKEDLQA